VLICCERKILLAGADLVFCWLVAAEQSKNQRLHMDSEMYDNLYPLLCMLSGCLIFFKNHQLIGLRMVRGRKVGLSPL